MYLRVASIVAIVLGLFGLVASGIATQPPAVEGPQVVIQAKSGPQTIDVELAQTPEEQALGLMNRTTLDESRGMLFPYPHETYLTFWMKNMKIPIDMLFIGADKTVKRIFSRVPPCEANTQCATYGPPFPVQYVLEVPSGYSQRHGIRLGNTVSMPEGNK